MSDLVSQLGNFALEIISRTGYAGIFLLSALESAAIPIPSEIVIPFSGFLAVSGRFSLWLVVLVATTANLIGSAVLFWIGRSGGRWVLEHYGKYILVGRHDLERGDQWFVRYGVKAVFWGRMLPIVRTFISLPAGVARMNFWRFSLFTILGSLPWNLALVFIGYKAGERWNLLHDYFRRVDKIIVIAVVLLLIWYIWKKKKILNPKF